MWLFLVHHGDALLPDVDPRRPLSVRGRGSVKELAERAAQRGVNPKLIRHSGKLRARETAEAFWLTCNPLAEFRAVPGLQPADYPDRLQDLLLGETRDLMVVGHMPNLARVLSSLTSGEDRQDQPFPLHGVVALERETDDGPWLERWRLEEPA
jgi:phosphohistidine phosphatase